MTSPSGAAYMGGQMSRRDEEFHQTLIVLEHICDVSRITKVTLAFCCPFGHSSIKCSVVSSPYRADNYYYINYNSSHKHTCIYWQKRSTVFLTLTLAELIVLYPASSLCRQTTARDPSPNANPNANANNTSVQLTWMVASSCLQ